MPPPDPAADDPGRSGSRRRPGAGPRALLALLALAAVLVRGGGGEVCAQGGNLKLGPVEFDLTGYTGLEYNDNLSYSGVERLEDFIFTVGMNFDGSWEVTPYNTLSLSFDLAYIDYFDHSQFDSANNFLTIRPDSELTYAFLLAGLEWKVYDRLSYSFDPADAFGVDLRTGRVLGNVERFGRFENTLGVSASAEPVEDYYTTLSFSRYDLIPDESTFDHLRRTTYDLSATVARQFNSKSEGDVTAGWFWSDSAEGFNNDSTGFHLRASHRWTIAPLWKLHSWAGWRWENFDSSGAGGNGDSSDLSDPLWGFSVLNDPHPLYSHQLSFSRTVAHGYVSNSTRSDLISYRGYYSGLKEVKLDGGVSWHFTEDSGGLASEKADRLGFDIGYNYRISRPLSYDVRYYYSTKGSDLSGRNYDQNRFSIVFSYDF